MAKILVTALIFFSSVSFSIAAQGTKMKTTKLKITIGNTVANATLYDNPTAQDFASQLPLKLNLKDYASTEKVSDLPKKLTTKDAPTGSDPSLGDIAYYAPWGNLALYYKDFGYSNGLVIIGKIDSGIEAFKTSGSLQATIEVAD